MDNRVEQQTREMRDGLADASVEAQKICEEILAIEQSKIYMASPYGIHDEIIEMIERIVQ